MIKLAKILKENNIRFRWTIFTDLNLYNKKPIELEEVVYMKPSYDFTDYIKEADYGVQLSDTEGYSYFINECLQQGTPVICTNFPSAFESVENEINGYILDMELNNLNLDKILNNIPKDFVYIEKCTEKDWIEFLNKESERRNIKMFKIIAKTNYRDTKPELIEEYESNNEKAEFNEDGSLSVKKDNTYIIQNVERAEEIRKSGLATVIEIKTEEDKTKEQSETEVLKEEKQVINNSVKKTNVEKKKIGKKK